MKLLARALLQRLVERRATAFDLARLPALHGFAGGGLRGRLAAAGLLRLALRWPALTWILVVVMVAARIVSRRRRRPTPATRRPDPRLSGSPAGTPRGPGRAAGRSGPPREPASRS